MRTITCTTCAGTGYAIGVKSGGHLHRDYNTLCADCGGTRVIYDYNYSLPKKTTPVTKTNKPTSKNQRTHSSSKTNTKSDFSTKDFFTLVGFVLGGILGYQATNDWITTGIVGLITGVILRFTYKLIFVIIGLIILFYIFSES